MIHAAKPVYQSNDLVPVLRELFSQHPTAMSCGPETLVQLLFVLRYVNHRPPFFEVEAASEALQLEDGKAA